MGYYTTQLDEDEVRAAVNGATTLENVAAATREWMELDKAALYGVAGDLVRLLEPHTEADSAALLFNFLAAAGNCVGRIACLAPDRRPHYANLFVLVVGDTAKARKGSAEIDVRMFFERVARGWVRDNIESGLSSGEGVIYAVRDPVFRTEAVKQRGRVADYQKVMVDPGVEDKRLHLVEPEFAGPLKILLREGNILSPVLRRAWDSGDLHTLTKNSPLRATGAHVSIAAQITIDELLRHLDATEQSNGFANRFLFCCARRSKVLPRGCNVSNRALDELARRTAEALETARKAAVIEFGEDALCVWDAVYPKLSEARPGLLGALTARSEAQVARLSFVYAALDGCHVVEPAHLKAALACWAYAEASVSYLFADHLGDPVADTVLDALRQRPQGMNRTEISALFGRNLPAEKIARALATLLKANLVQCQAKGSHTAEIWRSVAKPAAAASKAQEPEESAPASDESPEESAYNGRLAMMDAADVE